MFKVVYDCQMCHISSWKYFVNTNMCAARAARSPLASLQHLQFACVSHWTGAALVKIWTINSMQTSCHQSLIEMRASKTVEKSGRLFCALF